MKLSSKFNNLRENYFSILISLLPISFIAGNTIININISLLVLSGLIFLNKDLFKIRYFFLDKIIIFYFFLVILVAIYNDFYLYFNHNDFSVHRGIYVLSIKSLLFLRFLFLYLIIRILVEKEYLNLKPFFFISSFCALFVCFDIFFQFINGKDLFGYEVNESLRKLGGPFGDEYIAGGYIQRFSLFSFFLIPIFLNKNKNKVFILNSILFIIFFTGIILSGNRMPLLIFTFILSILFFLNTNNIKNFLFLISFTVVVFFLIFKFNEKVRINFEVFYKTTHQLIKVLGKKDSKNLYVPYRDEFISGYNAWLLNKTFGGGVKNFNFYCHKSKEKFKLSYSCNTHPHNYYLENLTDLGLIGFLILSIIVVMVLYKSFVKKYFLKFSFQNNIVAIPFVYLFFAEFFPLKSTGSFFTTGNASYIFFITAILVGLIRKENSIEIKL